MMKGKIFILERVEKLKLENEEKILLVRSGAFVIAVGNDAIFLSELFGFKKKCLKPGLCKIGIPVTYAFKYLELIEDKELLFDYDKNTKELIEKYKCDGSKEVGKINFDCKKCERYKEEKIYKYICNVKKKNKKLRFTKNVRQNWLTKS